MSDLFSIPWITSHQAPLSMGFLRQEYWSGLLFSSTGDLPDPGIKPASPALAGRVSTAEPPGKPIVSCREVTKKYKHIWCYPEWHCLVGEV